MAMICLEEHLDSGNIPNDCIFSTPNERFGFFFSPNKTNNFESDEERKVSEAGIRSNPSSPDVVWESVEPY